MPPTRRRPPYSDIDLTLSEFGADRRVYLSNAMMESKSAVIQGSGHFTFDQQLDFKVDANIRGEIASLLGGQPDATGQR